MASREFTVRRLSSSPVGLSVLVLLVGCNGSKTPPTGHSPDPTPKGEPRGTGIGGKSLTLRQLTAGLPEDARPKASGDKVRTGRANEWLAKNAVGKLVEDRHVFESVALKEGDTKRFTVTLTSNINWASPHKDNRLEIPGVPPDTLDDYAKWPVQFCSDAKRRYDGLIIEKAGESQAQRLFDLTRKPVVVGGKIEGAVFVPGSDLSIPPTLSIVVSDVHVHAAPPTPPTPEPKKVEQKP